MTEEEIVAAKSKVKTPEQAELLNSLLPDGVEKIDISKLPEINNETHEVTPILEVKPIVEVKEGDEPVIKLKKIKEEKPKAEVIAEDDIDDAKMLKALSKKLGREITSLDEISNTQVAVPTAEDVIKQKEKRESSKLNYGLTNGLIAKKDYESYVVDMANPLNVLYEDFKADKLSDNPSMKEADIKEEFNDTYNQDKDETTPEYKLGKKRVEREVNEILRSKHSKVLSLENAFEQYEKGELSQKEQAQILAKETPKFKGIVEEVRNEVKKLQFNIAKTTFNIDVDEEIVNDYTEQMLTPEYAAKMIKKGYTKEEIKANIVNAIKLDNFETLMTDIIEQDRLTNQAGQRGVQPKKEHSQRAVVNNSVQEKSLAELEERLGMTAN